MQPPGLSSSDVPGDSLRETAARWVVRHDRGLSAVEFTKFQYWVEADPRHRAAFDRAFMAWKLLDGGVADVRPAHPPVASRPPVWLRPALGGLAAAIVLGLIYLGAWRTGPEAASNAPAAALVSAPATAPDTRVLADGTTVRLNAGASVQPAFTLGERRVRLEQGEAYFIVTHDAARPFIVEAGGVAVRAVGTAFNVRLQEQGIDVLVTQGRVEVDVSHVRNGISDADAATRQAPPAPPPLIGAGQRAIVDLLPATPHVVVTEVTADVLARELAWREPLLSLGGATLEDLALQFERNTGRKIVLRGSELGELRIGGRFPSDDLDGFVRLMQENYGVHCERLADGTLVLSQTP
jgi:transmembrane sensor